MLAIEHDERQRPAGRRPEQHDALQDGVGLGAGGRGRRQHRKDVCRDVADRRGDQKGPGALEAGRLAERELLVAARTAPFVLAGRGAREQAADFAALQALLHRGQGGRTHDVPSAIRSPAASRRAAGLRPLDPVPHLAGIEARLHPGEQEDERPEHEQRHSRDHRRVVRDLDEGDQHAEHHDLDHAPGPRRRMMAQQRPHPSRRAFATGPEHDRQHEADLQRRRDDGGEEHQHRDDLLPVLPEMLGASDHGGGGLRARRS